MRVPVEVDFGGATLRAEVLGTTDDVLLLQAGIQGVSLPPIGTMVRLRTDWDRQTLTGRLAAPGAAGRFLVALGERAIRRSRRFAVQLPGIVRSAQVLQTGVEVRISDLSQGGARVEGVELPVGAEVDLQFTPPGRSDSLRVFGFVVRVIDNPEVPTVGVAFRLAQPGLTPPDIESLVAAAPPVPKSTAAAVRAGSAPPATSAR